MTSASLDCFSENVGVLTIVVAKLKFSDVERQVFFADFMECAHHPTLNQRPETFNRIRVNRADDILTARMVDCRVRKSS
ncbi:MAG: hypothetical protein WA926_10880 [Methylovirgula sp.]